MNFISVSQAVNFSKILKGLLVEQTVVFLQRQILKLLPYL